MKALARMKKAAKELAQKLDQISQSQWEGEVILKVAVPQPVVEVHAKLRRFKSMAQEIDDENTKAGDSCYSDNE